eukprot:1195378-Prorocentrum_minimum.AAC.2
MAAGAVHIQHEIKGPSAEPRPHRAMGSWQQCRGHHHPAQQAPQLAHAVVVQQTPFGDRHLAPGHLHHSNKQNACSTYLRKKQTKTLLSIERRISKRIHGVATTTVFFAAISRLAVAHLPEWQRLVQGVRDEGPHPAARGISGPPRGNNR